MENFKIGDKVTYLKLIPPYDTDPEETEGTIQKIEGDWLVFEDGHKEHKGYCRKKQTATVELDIQDMRMIMYCLMYIEHNKDNKKWGEIKKKALDKIRDVYFKF